MQFSLPAEDLFLDLSDRTKLRLSGADRVRFLNGQVSNDLRLATAERSVYTGVMTIKGKLCADAFVHDSGDALLLDAPGELREALSARLERYIIADDVQIEDVTAALGLLHLVNFASPGLPPAPADLGSGVSVVRANRFHHEGWDVFHAADKAHEVHARVSAAGFTELNEDALESLRILLGVPRWGAELDENTLTAEAGIEDRAVSFSKGCYIGQEVVSRVRSVGHVNRHLCGLRALDSSPLYPGMRLFLADDAGGKEIGRITSAAPSAGHGGAAFVALGYLRRDSALPGTVLDAISPPGFRHGGGPSALPRGSLFPALSPPMNMYPFRTRFLSGLWLAASSLCLLAAQSAVASVAVIHFQTGAADQIVTITLFDQDAPVTVENFKRLVAKKFYNGLAVHRIVPETLVQMGDPLSRKSDRSKTGTGGPGYTLPAEIHRKHVRGAVAMAALPPALNPSRASNGSQFYIVLRPEPDLDKDYTVFGQVTEGLDFLDSISRRGRDTNDYPLEQVSIRSIELK